VAGRRIGEVYVPAWEGGHADHDAAHLIGVALARGLGIRDVYACPSYNAAARFAPFRVMKPIPRAGRVVETLRLSLAQGLFCFALCECHPSQWRTWIGLGPESFVRLVVQRSHYRWRVITTDYATPPHSGPLLYEKRFGTSFDEFRSATGAFVARHLGDTPASTLTNVSR
jgi:hypothetical protein